MTLANPLRGLTGTCPLCRGVVAAVEATAFDEYVSNGFATIGRPLPRRPRETLVAACADCEFVVDLQQSNGCPKTSVQLIADIGRFLS